MTDGLETRWRPLDVRESGNYGPYDALHPGVPSHLRSSLWDWVVRHIQSRDDLLQIERVLQMELLDPRYGNEGAISQLQTRAFQDPDFFLTLIFHELRGGTTGRRVWECLEG